MEVGSGGKIKLLFSPDFFFNLPPSLLGAELSLSFSQPSQTTACERRLGEC
jgi:hypothetical protein